MNKKVKKVKKIITSFILTIALLFVPCQAEERLTIDDKIEALEKLGVINYYEDGSFKPEKEITRAEFCKMIALITGYNENYEAHIMLFNDVSYDHWAYEYIDYCYQNGYIEAVVAPQKNYVVSLDEYGNPFKDEFGYKNLSLTKFSPEEKMTYPECFRTALQITGYAPRAEMRRGYPAGYVDEAVIHKLITGDEPDYATDIVTREMAAEIVYNTLYLPLMLKKPAESSPNQEWFIADGTNGLPLMTLYSKYYETN